jgi:hypothetical protein
MSLDRFISFITLPVIPASCIDISSSFPRLPEAGQLSLPFFCLLHGLSVKRADGLYDFTYFAFH